MNSNESRSFRYTEHFSELVLGKTDSEASRRQGVNLYGGNTSDPAGLYVPHSLEQFLADVALCIAFEQFFFIEWHVPSPL